MDRGQIALLEVSSIANSNLRKLPLFLVILLF